MPQKHQVLKPEIAQQILGLLQNVVQNGTATAAKSLGRPIGGKTGTTDNFTDAWFIGFTPSITAAVWVGFDEKKTLGDKQSGAVVALPIWIECMKEILKDKPVENFPSVENAGPDIEWIETPLISKIFPRRPQLLLQMAMEPSVPRLHPRPSN